MITIGIDANEANVTHRVGIGQYAYQLVRGFYNLHTKKEYSFLRFNIYLKEFPLADMPEPTVTWKYHILQPKKLWTQFALPVRLLAKKENSIFFTPSHYAPRFSNIPTVISIMDLSFLHYPHLFVKKDYYQLKNWTDYSAKNAKCIFTISEFSKSEIVKYYHIDPQKIIVGYPGINTNIYKRQIVSEEKKSYILSKYSIRKDFILFVGTIQPRKNIRTLLDAFEGVSKNQPSLQLLLVGKKGWMYEEILSYKPELFSQANIVHTDFIPDNDLALLYNLSQAFILPSYYEGFGLPVIEAMACGCPTIVANTSSLPEISGGASLIIDPDSPIEISKAIMTIYSSESTRKTLAQKGILRAKEFDWNKTSARLLDKLVKLANTP